MSPRIGLDQAALLGAAAELADAHGFEAVTLASLAQKLNVRSPSLYNHVAGLPELRRLLALNALERLNGRLVLALDGKQGDEAMRSFCAAYLQFARTHPGLYEAVQRAPEPEDEQLQQAGGTVVRLALDALSGFELQGDAAIHAVRGIRSLLHGFVSLERVGGFGMPLDTDATFRMLVDTYMEGLRQRAK
ncbi:MULTISPECIES: TetR-like C-terminal domain-containing protein [unclassified Paenibacillus]|uniref:TetR-like C-terminal domain-containing protein n=1 Tax=unclassified Paenibacillus TaxID=185978 RepID=UPI000955E390|nr:MULTISPECIES: TetR-like C-terminal domain-containing protein [unclassified Paenibacillus]ASS65778.1 TetR/AcrR family transcriptional regulator [Paenibacillus sp. RUD330]SIQ24158.1 transcriptional regulator, TetR family [Paenibacillus sp. RU4X]SIQ45906.1 transcriptional regulator, TetR family [Paenibacillus sp. RU4T]